MKKVAVVGTQGVPASYGGFESLVENIIGENCSPHISYTVFCSGKSYSRKSTFYKGARLKYIPLHANGSQSILYDILSLIQVIRGYDVIVVLGVSGCIFLPVFRLLCRKKLIVNIDGLEHRRDKWNKYIRRFLLFSEALAVKYADVIIADNKGIQDYVYNTYKKRSELIAYGGDHALRPLTEEQQISILSSYRLSAHDYDITICRIEPENNCHIILDAFSQVNKQLIFIGNWEKSNYGKQLKADYNKFTNLRLLNPVYDLDTLYALRKNARYYIHGHSAGGTNPSLVEAMFFGRPVLAYDVIYNRETTEGKAHYFKNSTELQNLISYTDMEGGDKLASVATNKYNWITIAKQYEALYL